MKLKFKDDFQLEIPLSDGTEKIIKGYVKELTTEEQSKLVKITEDYQNKFNRFKKLSEANVDTEEFRTLKDEVTNINILVETLREKFNLTVFSNDKDELRGIAEMYGAEGYQRVLNTIAESVKEIKEKK